MILIKYKFIYIIFKINKVFIYLIYKHIHFNILFIFIVKKID